MADTQSLISAADREKLAQLQLLARQVVEGVTVGIHRSPHKGFSVEFKEHRPYVRGDEIRSIDWKLFGKTDRLFIRQYEEETNLRCTIAVDQSGSMKYSGKRSGGLTKHDYAVRLTACLAYMLISQQDSVGLATFDTTVRTYIPPRSRPNHLRAIFESLSSSQPGNETGLSESLKLLIPKLRRRGLLVLISDCFGDVEALLKTLAGFRHARNEVVLMQVFDPDELDFPFRQRTQFRSLENASPKAPPEKILDPNQYRERYLANLKKFRDALQLGCGKQRIDLLPMTTDRPYAEALAAFLVARGNA